MPLHRKKFLALAKQKQINHLLKLICEIETNWKNVSRRQNTVQDFVTCVAFLNQTQDPDLKQFNALKSLLPLANDLRAFLKIIVPLEAIHGINMKDDAIYLRRQDGPQDGLLEENNRSDKVSTSLPLYAILDNIRSAYNVGAIFRTAECLNIKELILCGYTPTPDNHRAARTAMGTDKHVAWRYIEKTEQAIQQLKAQSVHILALETCANSETIYDGPFTAPNNALILGNEVIGISKEILSLADKIIHIPVFGWKNSLNVGTAFALAGYEYRRSFNNRKPLPISE